MASFGVALAPLQAALWVFDDRRNRQDDRLHGSRCDLPQPADEALPIHATQLQGIDSRRFRQAVGGIWIDPYMPDVGRKMLLPISHGGNQFDRQAADRIGAHHYGW